MAEMTILQVLKRIKHIDRKLEKIGERVARWCSYYDIELEPGQEPPYNVDKLLQKAKDLRAHRAALRHALHKANINHSVGYNGKNVTFDELLILRTITLPQQKTLMSCLRRKEKNYHALRHLTEEERKEVRVVNQFNPTDRDKAVDDIDNEMAKIDEILDELNISTPIEL